MSAVEELIQERPFADLWATQNHDMAFASHLAGDDPLELLELGRTPEEVSALVYVQRGVVGNAQRQVGLLDVGPIADFPLRESGRPNWAICILR